MFSLPLSAFGNLPTSNFLTVAPSNLIFSTPAATTNPSAQSFNLGTIDLSSLNVGVVYTTNIVYDGAGSGWLSLSGANGTVSAGTLQNVTVNVNASGLANNNYTAKIVITNTAKASDNVTVNVRLTVGVPGDSALPYTYNLPFLANNAGGFTSFLALQNTTTTTNNVTIDFYNTAGSSLSSVSTTLGPNAEVIPNNPFANNTTGTGIVHSSGPLNVIVAEGTPAGGSAYAVGTGAGSQLVDPLAINNSGNFRTQLTIYNSDVTAATATVTFFNADGSPAPAASTKTINIAGHTVAILDQTASDSSLPAGFYGWAQISGSAGSQLVGQILEQNSASHFVAIANAETTPQSTLYAPAIFKGAFGAFVTGANIVNTSANTLTVYITYYDTNGVAVTTQPFTLGPRAIAGIFQGGSGGGSGLPTTGLPVGFTGSALVQASGGGIVMAVNEAGGLTQGGTAQSGTYLALASGGSNFGLPSMARGGIGYYTGATILNTSEQTVNGSVHYFGTNGQAVGTVLNFTVAPHASQLVFQGDPASGLPDGFFGTAIISQTSGPTNSLMVTTNAQSYNFFYTYNEPSQQQLGNQLGNQ